MKQIFLLPFLLSFFLIPCSAKQPQLLRSREKIQIIKDILKNTDFLTRHLLAEERKETVYLSTENIPAKFIPKIFGIEFVLLSPQEIKQKTDTLFGYYVFEVFTVRNSRVVVSFGQVYQDTRKKCSGCAGSSSSTRGIRYEFHKINGKWQGRQVEGYASGS